MDPAAAAYVPFGHGLHSVAAASLLNPDGHGSHPVMLRAGPSVVEKNEPAVQPAQSVTDAEASDELRNRPIGQEEQLDEPAFG